MLTEKPSIKLDFTAEQLRNKLEPLCLQVFEHFQMPNLRLYCYFASTDDLYLRAEPPHGCGRYYRGFHTILAGKNALPTYLQNCFLHPMEEILKWPSEGVTFAKMVAFDSMIYLRDTTCRDSDSFVITLSHELQHFIQYAQFRKIWAANMILYYKIRDFGNTSLMVTDIPYEREANIVSKRVAEAVCGTDVVRRFADAQVSLMESLGEHEQKFRYQFFRDVSSITQYDLLQETIPLVDMFRAQLIAGDFGKEYNIDFSHPQWWK